MLMDVKPGGRGSNTAPLPRGLGCYFFTASELLVGGPSSGAPFLKAVFMNLSPSLAILLVQPDSQLITAAPPSSFQVPLSASGRVDVAAPPAASVISNGSPLVFLTAQVPSNSLAAKLAKLAMAMVKPATSAVTK